MKRTSSLLLEGQDRRRSVELLHNDSRGDECGASCCGGIAMLMTTPRGTTTANPLLAAELVEENGDPMALMAKEMNLLSLQEREKAYEDLHGVSAMVRETPELIAASLQTMEHHLQSTIRHKPAYHLAQAQNRHDYVQDTTLRLMFLRAERFHAEKAANRLVRWLDWKLELFGTEKLCQAHIGLAELDADARFMIETGIMQFLPARDSCGRLVQIVANRYHRHWKRSSKALLQLFFYMSMIAAEDETNQKSGVVHIVYVLGKEQPPIVESPPNEHHIAAGAGPIIDDRYEMLGFANMTTCLPVRWDALHYVTMSRVMQFAPALYTKTMGWHVQARFRVHIGSHLECQYGLLSFGVPSTLLPFTVEGELKTNNHKKWIQRRLVKDQEVWCHRQPQPQYPSAFVPPYIFPGIDMPGRNDVLSGQGHPIQEHAGNRRLHDLLEAYLDEYNNSPKDGGRADVARKIIFEIKYSSCSTLAIGGRGGGGRFLQLSSKHRGWWEEVTDEEALILKICNRLRNVRKRKTPK